MLDIFYWVTVIAVFLYFLTPFRLTLHGDTVIKSSRIRFLFFVFAIASGLFGWGTVFYMVWG
jgi:hypothetical protein